MKLDGVVVIDKPGGMSSAQVVARVKHALRADRVGHTGTLDPMATGVLPLVVGDATKIAAFLLADDKAYEGELILGMTTSSHDVEGEVLTRAESVDVAEKTLRDAMSAWVGDRAQIPPMVSALKQNGQRLYDLARKGVTVEREARAIHIAAFELLSYADRRARFRVACTKGTYVRSLVRDIGDALGCGATLSALRRTRAGLFDLSHALPLAEITPELAAARAIPLGQAITHLPGVPLDAATATAVRHGKPMAAFPDCNDGSIVRLLANDGSLAAVAEVAGGRFRYLRVFPSGG